MKKLTNGRTDNRIRRETDKLSLRQTDLRTNGQIDLRTNEPNSHLAIINLSISYFFIISILKPLCTAITRYISSPPPLWL